MFNIRVPEYVKSKDLEECFTVISNDKSLILQFKDIRNKNGDTLGHLAAQSGCLKLIKLFAENENMMYFDTKNFDGKTPLHIAAQSSQLECVQLLLSFGVAVDALKRSDWTPLMLACTKNNLEIIKELIFHGANLNRINKDGWTAFHIASREGNLSILKYLLSIEPSLFQTKSKNGRTSLHTACLHGHLELVKLLINDCKCFQDVQDSCGTTPLMDAILGNHNHILKFLLQSGADVNKKNKLERNVLHLASEMGNEECISSLVKSYCMAVDEQTSHGLAPLHFACKVNSKPCVCLLLELGANVLLEDNMGRTANLKTFFAISSSGTNPRTGLDRIDDPASTFS